MRSFKFSSIFAVMLAVFIAIAGVEVFAQGKGKGRGNEKERGGQRAERGGGHNKSDRGRGRSVEPQASKAFPGWQSRGRGSDKPKDKLSGWQGRGNQRRVQAQSQHIWQAQQRRDGERRGRGNDRRFERQIVRQPQIIPAQKWRFPQFEDRRRGRDDKRRGRGGGHRRDRGDRNVFIQQQAPPFSGNWPKNYGQLRRAEVHQRNAERKALKEIQRHNRNWGDRWDQSRWSDDRRGNPSRRWANDGRRYPRDRNFAYSEPMAVWQQTYPPVFTTPTYRTRTFYEVYPQTNGRFYPNRYNSGYAQTYYDYDDRPSGEDILRNVIFAVLGGVGTPAFDQSYYPEYGAYRPQYYGTYLPQYAGYNSGYSPAGYGNSVTYYDSYLYDDPYYGEVLPVQYFVTNAPGGDLFRQIFGQLLAIGYDHGFRDGLNARRIRERDRTFYDPYTYENEIYDPYSVSLGYNRRCLSQGYELGYEDALNNVGVYDQFQHGDLDLVSVLIGAVSELM